MAWETTSSKNLCLRFCLPGLDRRWYTIPDLHGTSGGSCIDDCIMRFERNQKWDEVNVRARMS
eukprot:764002-Hanusia_phi.AAC.4